MAPLSRRSDRLSAICRFGRRWRPAAPCSQSRSVRLFTALPAHALDKVVGPDGKVTYADRLPDAAGGKVTH